MKIKSSFKDYYDCMLKYGQDDDLVYIREEKVISSQPERRLEYCQDWFEKHFYFGFAGKTFLCIHTDGGYFYNVDDYAEFRKTVEKPKKFEKWLKQKSVYRWDKNYYTTSLLFKEPYEKDSLHIPKRRFEKAPIWCSRWHNGNREVILNPRLNRYDFAKVMPPYQAYQELMMWMSNQVKPFKPIPKIDDKTLADAKGFDKFSFRKDKKK